MKEKREPRHGNKSAPIRVDFYQNHPSQLATMKERLDFDFMSKITGHISDLKPDFKAVPNPIALLRLLSLRQWLFFLVSSSLELKMPFD
jgi:hypothetical protein